MMSLHEWEDSSRMLPWEDHAAREGSLSDDDWLPDAEELCFEGACALHVEGVEIRDTHIGKGLFATRGFPVDAVIGEVDGVLIEGEDYSSNYAFDFGDNLSLEPDPPFRYLNHSCQPNCEYLCADDEGVDDIREARRLYIVALRDIQPQEEFTIDYGWGAESAIPCQCGSPQCRGWIVCEEELDQVVPSDQPNSKG